MQGMITGKWITGQQDLTDALEIRQKVFVQEQGFPAETERDAFDAQAMHALMFDGETPVATGRLYFDGVRLFLGRICVLKEYRGQSIGDLITRLMILRGFDFAKEIYLHAQLQAQGFYERYGFRAEGEPFLEEGQEPKTSVH